MAWIRGLEISVSNLIVILLATHQVLVVWWSFSNSFHGKCHNQVLVWLFQQQGKRLNGILRQNHLSDCSVGECQRLLMNSVLYKKKWKTIAYLCEMSQIFSCFSFWYFILEKISPQLISFFVWRMFGWCCSQLLTASFVRQTINYSWIFRIHTSVKDLSKYR